MTYLAAYLWLVGAGVAWGLLEADMGHTHSERFRTWASVFWPLYFPWVLLWTLWQISTGKATVDSNLDVRPVKKDRP